MVKFLWEIIRALRVRQWIKNFALFAGLIFSGQLDNSPSLFLAAQAFVIFSGLSSVTYLLNDVFDVERDKQHPFKKYRPIASGKVPVKVGIGLALGLIAILLPVSFMLSTPFFLACLGYLILQLLYSAYLKSVILLDVIVIATGFVLRVYAGVWIINAHLSVWFLLSVVSFALFLAIGKRRAELTLLRSHAGKHREILLHYPPTFLDLLTSMFATSAWLTYAIFAFQQPPVVLKPHLFKLISSTLPLVETKYLMATVPLVIYGVMRYLYVIYEKLEGESPERVLLTDAPLLLAVLLWLSSVILIIYYLGG